MLQSLQVLFIPSKTRIFFVVCPLFCSSSEHQWNKNFYSEKGAASQKKYSLYALQGASNAQYQYKLHLLVCNFPKLLQLQIIWLSTISWGFKTWTENSYEFKIIFLLKKIKVNVIKEDDICFSFGLIEWQAWESFCLTKHFKFKLWNNALEHFSSSWLSLVGVKYSWWQL